MAWHDELAKEFTNRNNIDPEETLIGEIILLNPIRVSLFNNSVIISSEDKAYICESLKNITGKITLNDLPEHGTVTVNFNIERDLNIGDKVLCVPLAKGQKYAIVDRIL